MMRNATLLAALLSAAIPVEEASAARAASGNRALPGWCSAPLPNIQGLTAFYGTIFHSGGYTLMVAPDETRPQFWKFQFERPRKQATYEGYAHARNEAGSVHLCMSGAAIATPYGASPRVVHLSLNGTVNPRNMDADVTIQSGGRVYRVSVHSPGPSPAILHGASAAMGRVLSIFNHHRWAELYRMMIPPFQRQVSKAQFIAKLEHSPDRYLAVHPSGQARLTTAGGTSFRISGVPARAAYVQPVQWTRLDGKTGRTIQQRGSIELVLIGKRWELMDTR